jgi:hypothetical protein
LFRHLPGWLHHELQASANHMKAVVSHTHSSKGNPCVLLPSPVCSPRSTQGCRPGGFSVPTPIPPTPLLLPWQMNCLAQISGTRASISWSSNRSLIYYTGMAGVKQRFLMVGSWWGQEKYGYSPMVMIGDGATDVEARQAGGADIFIGCAFASAPYSRQCPSLDRRIRSLKGTQSAVLA